MAKEYNEKGGLMTINPDEEDLSGKFDSLGRSLVAVREEQRREKCKF